MHVLVASDGNLPIDTTVQFVTRLAGSDGEVTLYTVVEVPRTLLEDLRRAYEDIEPAPPVDTDAEYVSATSATPHLAVGWPGDDTMITRYVDDVTERRLGPLRDALAAHGIEPSVVGEDAEDAARAILGAVDRLGADVLCIGARGLGRFEGLLGSTSTKLARRAPCPVLIIRD